ncbi:MAG TPA: adenylate/guanylate cyclase domain-containing protein [Candidatus Obscuribacterales bacterium]
MIDASDFLNAKILIVDDLAANVHLLDRMLSAAGYQSVASTQNPREVCELHSQNTYDLILLDLQMPGMDGFQVMEGLKQIERGDYLPVLVITAEPGHKLRALQAGAKDFISKPFEQAEVLARVHNMLEVRLLHEESKNYSKLLEQKIAEVEASNELIQQQSEEVMRLYNQVVEEQKLSERLLLNVMPHSIAERLKGRPEVTADSFTEVIADSFTEVTVLFADIVAFTKFAEGVSPEILVDLLNDIFTRFDNIADERGIEKIKTIGDAYMAVSGLPIPVEDHAIRVALSALDMLEALDQFNQQRGYHLQVRIGIATGAVVAGVIGKRKFFYDLWGDVVNTASRMESHGVPGRIHLTGSTSQHLDESFLLESRGIIEVKGKGEMHTWFLNIRQA